MVTRDSSQAFPPSSSAIKFPPILKGVLFDMDGTLSDSESLHFKAYQVVFARDVPEWILTNGEMTRDFYNRNMGGKTKLNALEQVLPDASPEQKKRLCCALEDAFNLLAQTELNCLPGVYQLLAFLEEKKIQSALVTNAPPSEMLFALDVLKLAGRFDAKVPSAECSAGKPSPEPYLEGLRRLGLEASECVAVEDSHAGIQSATTAGLFTIGVTTSRPAADILEMGAHMAVSDFEDAALLALFAANV